MTMTDGEREIAKQLKRIADALGAPTEDTDFAAPARPRPPRFMEPYVPLPWRYYTTPGVTWTSSGTTTTTGTLYNMTEEEAQKDQAESIGEPESWVDLPEIPDPPTESSTRQWEKIMRQEGEGDHLLNPDADKTGEDLDD